MRAALAAAAVVLALPAAAAAAPRLEPIGSGSFDAARPRHRARRRRRAGVRGREGRARPASWTAASPAAPFLDVTALTESTGSEQRPALDRLRARLRGERAFYVFFTAKATFARAARPASSRARGAPSATDPNRGRSALPRIVFSIPHPQPTTTTAASSPSGPTACSTPASATAAPRATPRTTRRTRRASSARSSASTRGGRRQRRRSGRSGCATRGASRSTASPATTLIGDVGGGARGGGLDPRQGPRRGQLRLARPARATPDAAAPSPARSRRRCRCRTRRLHGVIGGFVVRDPGLPTLRRPLRVRRPQQDDGAHRRAAARTPRRARSPPWP